MDTIISTYQNGYYDRFLDRLTRLLYRLPMNGIYYCETCKKINTLDGKSRCPYCHNNCSFVNIEFTTGFRLGIFIDIIFFILLPIFLVFQLYYAHPEDFTNQMLRQYGLGYFLLFIILPFVLMIGFIYILIFIEGSSILGRANRIIGNPPVQPKGKNPNGFSCIYCGKALPNNIGQCPYCGNRL